MMPLPKKKNESEVWLLGYRGSKMGTWNNIRIKWIQSIVHANRLKRTQVEPIDCTWHQLGWGGKPCMSFLLVPFGATDFVVPIQSGITRLHTKWPCDNFYILTREHANSGRSWTFRSKHHKTPLVCRWVGARAGLVSPLVAVSFFLVCRIRRDLTWWGLNMTEVCAAWRVRLVYTKRRRTFDISMAQKKKTACGITPLIISVKGVLFYGVML